MKSRSINRFSLTFDLSWKVMKDILTEYMGIQDFAAGSPRDTLQEFERIIGSFYDAFVGLEKNIKKYYDKNTDPVERFE